MKLSRRSLAPLFIFAISAPAALAAPRWQSPVGDGVTWLEGAQDPSGSWGTTNEFVDSATAVGALAEIDPSNAAAALGATWLTGQGTANSQFLARKLDALAALPTFQGSLAALSAQLLAARHAAETNTTLPNWPEGGWGVASGFASDCQSTALALLALERAGLAGGLSVENEALAAGGTNLHSWTIDASATKVQVLITVNTATVRFRMKQGSPPTGATPFFLLAPGTYLIVYPDSGLPFTPGLNFISVQSTAAAGSYTFKASYQTPALDTLAFAEALAYLKESQNPDGGWGVQRGQTTDVYTSLHALLALQAYAGYDLDAERAAGVAWLQSIQLAGGGFGFDGVVAIPYVTALAMLALVGSESFPFSAPTDAAAAALLGQQGVDGSWDSSAYSTALALRALWSHNQAPSADAGSDQVVTDVDNDGSELVDLVGGGSDPDGFLASFTWSEGGVPIASGASASVPLAVGDHTLVLTVEDDGGRSASDDVLVSVIDPCDAVTGLACQSSGPDVLLTWTNGQGYDFVFIYRDGLLLATPPGSDTSFTDHDVPTGTYTYTVEGQCSAGAAPGVDCILPHVNPCSAVTQLACSSIEADVVLTWLNAEPHGEIRVLRDGQLVATLAGNASSYVDLSLPSGSYVYTVQPLCADGVLAPGVDCPIDHDNPCDCTTYCTAKQTSLGCTPAIGTLGLPTLAGNDNFVVTVDSVIGQTTGRLVWSRQPNPPLAGGGGPWSLLGVSPLGGHACLYQPRLVASQSSGGSLGQCNGAFAFAVSDAFLNLQGLAPGDTVHFQCFFQDPGHPDGSNLGHSDGLEVVVLP